MNKTCKQCNEIKDKNEFSGRTLTCKFCTKLNAGKKREEKAISEGKIFSYKPRTEYDPNKNSKTCSKCKEEKELSEYYVNNKSKDGHCARCIKCSSRKKVVSKEDMASKICNTCGIRKELVEFFKDKECRLRHKNKCKKCESISKKLYRDNRIISEEDKLRSKEYHKKYREDNRDLINEKIEKYREDNRDLINDKLRKFYIINKDKFKLYGYSYRKDNKYKIQERNKNYSKNRRDIDISFKIKENIRISIGNSFRNLGYSKKSRTHEILGCSYEEFKSYLEGKFEYWMTWDNKGLYNGELNYGWDIDHIIPISSAETEEDIVKLNHFTNLQPLCSKVNRDIKRDRVDFYK